MAAAHPVVPLDLLFMRRLQLWFARQRLDKRHKFRMLLVPRSVSPDLEYWGSPPALLGGGSLGLSDVIRSGLYGRLIDGFGRDVPLPLGRRRVASTPPTAHINVLELAAVRKVLLHFFHLVHGRQVLIRTDSVSAAAYINMQGGVRSSALNQKEVELWLWAHQHLPSL